MSNILIVASRFPFPYHDGEALRVLNLCRKLSKYHSIYLVSPKRGREGEQEIKNAKIFKEIYVLPDEPSEQSLLRHIRISDESYHKLAMPAYYQNVVSLLKSLVEKNSIDVVMAITLQMAEYLDEIEYVKKIIDDYDCYYLTKIREFSQSKSERGLFTRLKNNIFLHRVKKQESRLAKKYDAITTISPVDLASLKELNKDGDAPIYLLPNGVSEDFLKFKSRSSEEKRAIAFWGNLNFLPNKTAINYFYREVFSTYLANEDITWHILGKKPSVELQRFADIDERIVLAGFVDDLCEYVKDIPIMVNPMVMGSGLKNKVLEAFAMGKVVVSTSLGMEAIGGKNGEQCIVTDEPKIFAKSILELLDSDSNRKKLMQGARKFVVDNNTWDGVGHQFSLIIANTLKK